MKVFCCPVSEASIYARITSSSFGDCYEYVYREQGSIRQAIGWLQSGVPVLVHVQWEEFFLEGARTEAEAQVASSEAQRHIRRFLSLGGKIAWTVHNRTPHHVPFINEFLSLRRFLAKSANIVLAHNDASVTLLQDEFGVARERIRKLPHPSYLGFYEDEERAANSVDQVPGRVILGFGSMRSQKGYARMLEMLPPEFMAAQNARIRLSGRGQAGGELRRRHADRPDVDWDLRYVPDNEVPDLIRSAACVVLPYEAFLTSGAALLVLTCGGTIVAPQAPQFREMLPPPLQRFLYEPGNAADMQRAVVAALTLSPAERRSLRIAAVEVARDLHPSRISAQLRGIYDELAQQLPVHTPPYARLLVELEPVEWRASLNPAKGHCEPLFGDWPQKGDVGENWGDKLNPVLMALLSGRKVLHSSCRIDTPSTTIYKVIGSGIASATAHHVVWGSGFIDQNDQIPTPRHICGVRGPLTREKLRAAGAKCPEVYGDPAVLMPLFYRPEIEVKYDLGIIQHFRDAEQEPLPRVPDGMQVKVIDIKGSIAKVINDILSCREIVSSSLHGLIAAHAYGVPATWVKFSNRPLGDDFKFRDYWASVGWPNAEPIWVDGNTSCADLIGPKERVQPSIDIGRLIEACPFIEAERKASLLRHAADVYPSMPPVSFLASAKPQTPLLSVLIGIRNWGLDRLELALRSIREGEGGDRVEIILSDFGSDNRDEVAAVGRRFSCRYVYSKAFAWSRSQAINAAASVATAPYIVTSDADILFAPRSLSTLHRYLEALPDCVHVLQYSDLPQEFSVDGINRHAAFPWDEFARGASTRPRWGMGCVASTITAFDRIRGYDERMMIWGAEDQDFVQRARRNGYAVNWIEHPDVRLYHIWHRPFLTGGKAAVEIHVHNKRLLEDKHLERNYQPGVFLRTREPLVSVVISTRDRSALLLESIRSVLSQTINDFEVVIVDDGSVDDSEGRVRAIGDPRIRYHRIEKSVGLPAARNVGNSIARGKYIAVHDDDDLMLPERLEQQISALREGDIGAYGGWVDFAADVNDGAIFRNPGRSPFNLATLLFTSKLQLHPTLLIRRDVCVRHPYEERFLGGSDYHLVTRLAMAGYSLRHCGQYVTLRRIHPQNMTRINHGGQQVAARANRAAVLNFLPPAYEAEMREVGRATELQEIRQPSLTEQVLSLAGAAFGYSTEQLDFTNELFGKLRDAGVPFGVVVARQANGLQPQAITLDTRQRSAYEAFVPESGISRSRARLRRSIRLVSYNSSITDQFVPDNRLRTPRFPISAIDLDFFDRAQGRSIMMCFEAGEWRGIDMLPFAADVNERPVLVFEPDGTWRVLLDMEKEPEIGVRIAAVSHQARSLCVAELVEEDLI